MRFWTPEQVARAAGARLVSPPPTSTGPERVIIDSRQAGPGSLFVGLGGEHVDGGRFAPQALAAGAWGVLTTPEHAEAARCAAPGALIAADDPLGAMQRLATAWRRALDVQVIGVTGSTGKTSTKDLLLALLAPHRRTVASRANFNTEIGVPLEILAAPADTEVLVLEMAMRGAGQIAELAGIAEPDVGVIVSIGPVPPGASRHDRGDRRGQGRADRGHSPPAAPRSSPRPSRLLEPHLRADLETVTFGDAGDVRLVRSEAELVEIDLAGELDRARSAVRARPTCGATCSLRSPPRGRSGSSRRGASRSSCRPGRGQRVALPGG